MGVKNLKKFCYNIEKQSKGLAMKEVSVFDKMVSEKVFKKFVDKGYTKYSEIAVLMDVSDSFVKAVFSAKRKKLNLYHLVKIAYELKCNIAEFIPCLEEYKLIYGEDNEEYEYFLQAIKEEI